jgi:TRAP-type mannitol/chloroaromatic compound transport system permease small subunit
MTDLLLRTADGIAGLLGRAMTLVLGFVVLVIGYQVVARYVFRAPPEWGYDMIVYPMGMLYVLAGGYAFRQGAFVLLDTFVGRLAPRRRALLDLFIAPLSALFCAALLWGAWDWAGSSWRMAETTGSSARIPVWPFKWALVLGAAALLFQVAAKAVRDFRVATGRAEPPPPSQERFET